MTFPEWQTDGSNDRLTESAGFVLPGSNLWICFSEKARRLTNNTMFIYKNENDYYK